MKIRVIKPNLVEKFPWEYQDTVELDLDKLKNALGENRLKLLEVFILTEVNK